MGRTALDDHAVPAMNDPRWQDWIGPLKTYLLQARNWKTLTAWACAQRIAPDILRHMLAWLAINGVAVWDGQCWSRQTRKPDVVHNTPTAEAHNSAEEC